MNPAQRSVCTYHKNMVQLNQPVFCNKVDRYLLLLLTEREGTGTAINGRSSYDGRLSYNGRSSYDAYHLSFTTYASYLLIAGNTQ